MDTTSTGTITASPAPRGRLTYERQGCGEPLVLLHGLGSHWQVWEPILDALAACHDVIAVDLPGFGASAPDGTPPTVEGLATRVEEFLAALGIEHPHVAGSSLGGAIALELGRRGTAHSVTAFAPVGFWNTPERLWAQRLPTAGRALGRAIRPATPALATLLPTRVLFFGLMVGRPWQLERDQCLADLDALLNAPGFGPARDAWTSHRFDAGDPGALTGIPVTVAWGTRDVLLPYAAQHRRARTALPQAAHVRLSGCGHLPFSDDPVLCAQTVLGTTGATAGRLSRRTSHAEKQGPR